MKTVVSSFTKKTLVLSEAGGWTGTGHISQSA